MNKTFTKWGLGKFHSPGGHRWREPGMAFFWDRINRIDGISEEDLPAKSAKGREGFVAAASSSRWGGAAAGSVSYSLCKCLFGGGLSVKSAKFSFFGGASVSRGELMFATMLNTNKLQCALSAAKAAGGTSFSTCSSQPSGPTRLLTMLLLSSERRRGGMRKTVLMASLSCAFMWRMPRSNS